MRAVTVCAPPKAPSGGADDRLNHKVFVTRNDTVVDRLGPTMTGKQFLIEIKPAFCSISLAF